MYLPLRILIAGGMIWTLIWLVREVLRFLMAAVVIISSGCGLIIEAHCRNQPNKSISY